jgi:hypothetical protein
MINSLFVHVYVCLLGYILVRGSRSYVVHVFFLVSFVGWLRIWVTGLPTHMFRRASGYVTFGGVMFVVVQSVCEGLRNCCC